jgi:hypothetical protein
MYETPGSRAPNKVVIGLVVIVLMPRKAAYDFFRVISNSLIRVDEIEICVANDRARWSDMKKYRSPTKKRFHILTADLPG